MKTKQFVLVLLITLFIYSCEKEEVTIEEINLTEEIAKIETSYKEGDVKIEDSSNLNGKVETVASEEYMEELLRVVEKSFSKQKTYLKSGSTYYTKGVFKNTTCGNYKELEIFMDCEDSGASSFKSGSVGASYVTSGTKNVGFRVCVVDDVLFGPYTNGGTITYNYGVLNLGVQEPGVSRLVRGFDNEDSGNANYAIFDGSYYSGTMGDCHIGSGNPNTQLSFSYYDTYFDNWDNLPYPYTSTSMPNIGFSYYVLADWHTGYIYTDDEDRRNANYCYFEEAWSFPEPAPTPIYYTSGSFDGVLDVGSNTNIHFSKAN